MTNFRNYWDQAMSFIVYKDMLHQLMSEGKTTGDNHSPEMIEYAKLNLQRMKRVEKTFKPIPEWDSLVNRPVKAKYWMVLTEGWCGDAAQTVPAMAAIASMFAGVEIRFLLRDQHTDLMDQFLTRGGRAIPMMIFLDENYQLLGKWGARPVELQSKIDAMREGGALTFPQMVEQVHYWYAADKTESTQREIAGLLSTF
jgi:hypothetical protein